jgi:NADPH:quinone reductase-like Zn-dependent oxidoreductase
MLAALAVSQSATDPPSGLVVREVAQPGPPPGWSLVRVVASSLNMHDLWSLRGVGLPAHRLPRIFGGDAAGYTEDGTPVIVFPMISSPDRGNGDETLDPERDLLSERSDGTFAECLVVPDLNLSRSRRGLSFQEAACLPIAWGSAYRMLFVSAGIRPGDRVLVQVAGGGVSTAAIKIALAADATVYATSRSPRKLELAEVWGARGLESGARVPDKVDVVVETVGEATWSHSMRCLRPGGTIVIAGATTASNPPADLSRLFYLGHRIIGSTGCALPELTAMRECSPHATCGQ